MATTERYTTVIELNSEQAKRNLEELRKQVESWKSDLAEAKRNKMDKGFIASIRKELREAEKEMKKYDNEVARTIETMNDLNSASVKRIEEAQKSLKRLASEVPHDSPLYQQLNEQLDMVTQELENIKATKAFEQLQREAEGATKTFAQTRAEAEFVRQTVENIDTASLKQLRMAEQAAKGIKENAQQGTAEYNGASTSLEKIRAKLSDIDAQERKVVTTAEQYNQAMKNIRKEEKIVSDEMELIDRTLRNLDKASIRDIEFSIKALKEQLQDAERSDKSVEELTEKLKKLNEELKKVKDMQQPDEKKGNIFSRLITGLNTNWGAITQITGAITGLSTTVRGCAEAFAQMDQEMYNVTKYTGQTIEKVKAMNERFKEMDTRTSREELNRQAQAAGRLGITSEDAVMDFVDAADKINVALGDDLGQGAVDKIGKLAMAFGEDERLGLRGAMLATGSAVNELAQNSSAKAGYLVDFTARLSGVGTQAGLTQAQILGLAAAMDENMQRDEMAATAISQIITKMTTDSETFARIAGKNVSDFALLVKTDMNEALMQFFEAMNKKGGFADLAPMFEQMGLDGTRAIGVLSTLAGKIADVQRHQQLANDAYRLQNSVMKEFNVQNSTYQARLEKARKSFNDLKVELGEKLLPVVQYTISGVGLLTKALSTVAEFVTKNIGAVISLTATIAALTVVMEAHVIKQKLMALWNNYLKKSFTTLYATIAKHPFAALALAVSYVVGSFIDMRREADKAMTAQKVMEEASRKAGEEFLNEQSRIEMLSKVIHDNEMALDKRRQAIEQLKGIIPGYNALIDEEGRLMQENTAAIDEYLKRRKQELLLKAYEDELVEAYKRRAQTLDALKKLEEKGNDSGMVYEAVRKAATEASDAVSRLEQSMENASKELDKLGKSTAGTGGKPAGTEGGGSQAYDNDTRAYWEQQLKIRRERLQALREDAKATANEIETAAKAVKDAEDKVKLFTASPVAGGSTTDADRERRERLRKADDAAKAETERQLAELTHQYAIGKILYAKYVEEQERIQREGIERRMLIYSKESVEYQKLNRQREELLLNGSEEMQKLTLAEMKLYHEQRTAQIEEQAWREGHTEQWKNEQLFLENDRYLKQQLRQYHEGTLEHINLMHEIEERDHEYRLQREQSFQQQLQQAREQLLGMGNERLMQIEIDNINEVYDEMIEKGMARETERQEAILAIRAKYAGYQTATDRDQQKASQMLSVATDAAKRQLETGRVSGGSPAGKEIPFAGTIIQYQTTMAKLKELYGNDKENHAAYLAAKQMATAQFCQEMAAQMQTAYNTVNQVMSAASSYFSAQQDYETALVQKKYEKQIEAAGSNQKKAKKLQEQQQKEEAAIKSKYAKRAATIQMAQAVAQTAISAINAYSSAAAIPVTGFVLAPIAAAAAIAAGMLQIATIKKQQQAQEAGYYEGGFTHGRQYRKEAGVVHEGEFVANHQAVNNPAILPFLNFLDQAQRNNTVGSLTMQDVSRSMGAGGASQIVAPIVNVQTDNEELRQAVDAHREATELLLLRLQDPIDARVVLTGPDGLNEQQERLNSLLKNK